MSSVEAACPPWRETSLNGLGYIQNYLISEIRPQIPQILAAKKLIRKPASPVFRDRDQVEFLEARKLAT